jgi:hypothetical protein
MRYPVLGIILSVAGFLFHGESAAEEDAKEWYYCRSKLLIARGMGEAEESQKPVDARFARAREIRRRIDDEEKKLLKGEPNRYEELVEEYRVAVAEIGEVEALWTQETLRESKVSENLEKSEDPRWTGGEAISIDPGNPPEGMQCTPKKARDDFRAWLDVESSKVERGEIPFERYWEAFQRRARELERLTIGN